MVDAAGTSKYTYSSAGDLLFCTESSQRDGPGGFYIIMLKRHVFVSVFAILAFVIFVLMCLARTARPPDVISGKEVVVERCAIPNGESIELVQIWVGDGYMTTVRHNIGGGPPLVIVGNPDTTKVWAASMQLEPASAFVRICFGKKDWKYYYNSHSLSIDGDTRRPI